jgi:hypothetical protein
MNDNIDQLYLINKILQLNDRLIILEKKMQSYENNNKNLFQQSPSYSLNNIQNLNNNNDDNIIYDPINIQNNNINMQNNNINMQNNSLNLQNNNINLQNNIEINKIYDPLSN